MLFNALLATSLILAAPSPAELKSLLASLQPKSIKQHLAFYTLYPETTEGKQALQTAFKLLSTEDAAAANQLVEPLTQLILSNRVTPAIQLQEAELQAIEKLAAHLPNRRLKGHACTSEEQLLTLAPEEIDMARALFLSQLPPGPELLTQVRNYEAALDLMALQILTRLPLEAPAEEKIRAINHFLFNEMRFRYPPHSLYAKEIDTYSFLAAVMDSHRGVCLGTSALYLSLAQRLNLPLEIITPPGHIFIRYNNGKEVINIETTARGIHLPSDTYLGVNTRSLALRNLRDVIGMAFFNEASTFFQVGNYKAAATAYEKALKYTPNDPLITELLAYQYLCLGEKRKGEALLRSVQNHLPEDTVARETLASDLLNGDAPAEALPIIFKRVDETRTSILAKQEELQKLLKKYPKFRSGWFHLAITWLQLGREKEALQTLAKYHQLDPTSPTVEYYIAALALQRHDFPRAWQHLALAEELTAQRGHSPKVLRDLHRELAFACPQ